MCIFVAGRKQAKQTTPSPIPQTTTKPNKHKNKKPATPKLAPNFLWLYDFSPPRFK